jgi:hypothetical protein
MIVENVFCDRCNAKCWRVARGFHDGPWNCAMDCCWEQRGEKHLCPDCLDELDEQCRQTAEPQK